MSPAIQTLAAWLKAEPRGTKSALPIYQMDRPRFRPDQLNELAGLMEMAPDQGAKHPEPHIKDNIHVLQEGDKVLAFYEKSGAFCYSDKSKLDCPDYRPELPSPENAAEIAKEYLKKRGLLPDNARLDGAKLGLYEVLQGERREKSQVNNHIVVDFRLRYGELDTYGPGAKIKVYVGHKGEVIGVLHAARTAHRYAELPALPKKDLSAVLARKLGTASEKIEVRDVRLVLFADSYTNNTRFLHPVYIFQLATNITTNRQEKPVTVSFMSHPIPATAFAPQVSLTPTLEPRRIYVGEVFRQTCKIQGGTKPYQVRWYSDIDGLLSDQLVLDARKLSVAHRQNKVTSHTIQVVVTDVNGFQDSHQILVRVLPRRGMPVSSPVSPPPPEPDDPYVGVEWCNLYHGSAADISGTTESARGFKDGLKVLPGWSAQFDWGNDAAWEEDFKRIAAPGGGTDSYWADNVHFAFFAGHGSSGAFYFGSTVDDHQMIAADARWGDGLLNWITLHACNTMMNNFNWTVWCDSFVGLHQMFGFHTTTEGSTPPLGSRFAFWASWAFFPWITAFDLQTAWRLACSECFDASVEYSVIYANQAGTDTQNDHLPGFGYVSADPTNPNVWCYFKGSC